MTSIVLLGATALALAQQPAPRETSGQPIETVETAISAVRALLPTPPSFDALKASNSDLERYGLPARPDRMRSPLEFAQWQEIVEQSRKRKIPQLKASTIFHGPVQGLKVGKKAINGSTLASALNWSGFAISSTTAFGKTSGTVSGIFAVPKAEVCMSREDYHSANWVGVDGYGSNDVLQVGTETDITCPSITQRNYVWVEWYPYPQSEVANFLVNAGDSISVSVMVFPATKHYQVNYWNNSLHEGFGVQMSPPGGTQLIGSSIEWIIEAPQVNGGQSVLTPYAWNFWKGLKGVWTRYLGPPPIVYTPSSSSGTITLTLINGASKPLSAPTLSVGPYPKQYENSAAFQFTHP